MTVDLTADSNIDRIKDTQGFFPGADLRGEKGFSFSLNFALRYKIMRRRV